MALEDVELELIDSVDMASQFLSWLGQRRDVLAFDTETTGLDPERDRLRLVQFGDQHRGWSIPWEGWGGVALEALAKYDGALVAHNAKFDVRFIERHGKIRLPRERIHDTRIMAHLIDPLSRTGLKPLAARLVDARAAYASQALDEAMAKQNWTWATVPIDFPMYWLYGAMDTVLTAHLFGKLYPTIQSSYAEVYNVEQMVQFILGDMEARGARIDLDYTKSKAQEMVQFALSVDDYCMKNYKINPGSNRDVSRVLQELGVELTVRTASGAFALDEEVLTSIIGGPYDEIDFDQLLEGPRLAYYVIARRKVEKMRSTYLESFLGAVDSDGFVHAQINQLGAKTGRMSMERPALQTLPRGRVIRDCFIPREGHSLISADFDGIEMRLLAHFAKDPALIEAIHSGDIHLATAQRVYADNTITKKDPKRQIAKNVGFAKIYGAGVEKIAATAGVSVEAARDFLTSYDSTFPGVKAFQNQVAQIATQRSRQEGVAYVRTPLGRRQVSDGDKDYALVNFLIQGMAADVFKEALVRLAESDIGDYLMLPVHDEIIADVPTEDVEEYMNMLTKIMADDRWEVPLTVGVDGPLSRWGDKYA